MTSVLGTQPRRSGPPMAEPSAEPPTPNAALDAVRKAGGGGYDDQAALLRPPAPPQASSSRATLRRGAKGPDVTHLQQRLNAAGYAPALVPDGIFGRNTRAAVVWFQQNHADAAGKPLDVDGIVGPKSWGALEAGGAAGPTPTPAGKEDKKAPEAREDDDAPAAPPPPAPAPGPATLTNAMFAGQPELEAVLRGDKTIKSGRGDHITAIQTALINLGYNMPVYGADGGWGGETVEALGQFQAQHVGKRTGVLDRATMGALDARAVPTREDKNLRYDELFKDGLLDFTVGVGYDEDGYFDKEIRQIRYRIEKELGLKPASAADAAKMYGKAGMGAPSAGGGEYYAQEGALTYNNQKVNVLVRLVTYQDPEAKKAFLEAMQNSDVALYTGHGRYGSGPDFDHKSKGEGNIWINPEQTVKDHGTAGMYDKLNKGGAVANELQQISFDKKYKVWFFDGCNTVHYMKPIRQNKTIDPTKTDVFGWGTEVAGSTTDVDVLTFIAGLMKQKTPQQIINDLNKANGVKDPRKGAQAEGLGDNPKAA